MAILHTRKSYETIKAKSGITEPFEFIVKQFYNKLPENTRAMKIRVTHINNILCNGSVYYTDLLGYNCPLWSTSGTKESVEEQCNKFIKTFFNVKEVKDVE